ncbi:MAG TPA: TonB-dependent siderophore receptor [Alcaligenes sp.]|nr:TonB-dependent siderophore receptor [Alcaligenes sp.]HRL26460.1 TonB-dependent siderophore receptor [Alcaligenes sp.]
MRVRSTYLAVSRPALGHWVFAASLLCSGTLAPVQAQPQAAAQVQVQIAAGTLDQVLNRFAAQGGFMLAIDGALTAGKSSAGLSGRYTPQQGLTRILRGSGLEAVAQGDGFRLRPVPARSSRSYEELEAVRVQANRETATGPANGLLATRSATATKSDVAIMDTPASVAVVTQQQIESQATRTVGEALRYVPGVAVEFDGVDSRFDTMSFRGFNADSVAWLDGIKLAGGSGAGNNWTLPQVDPFMLERIEVLKGPASVVYGQVVPGGMVNMVSKRPTRVDQRNIELTVGAPRQLRGSVDLGGALGEQGVSAWRLLALNSDTESRSEHVKRKRTLIALSVTLPLGEDGEIVLMGSIQRDRGGSDYMWLPAYGTLFDNPNGKIPISRFIGEPHFDRYDRDQDMAGWSAVYDVNDNWTLRQNLRVQRIKSVMESVTSDMYAYDDPSAGGWDWRTLERYANRGTGSSRSLGVDTQSEWRFSTGQAEHAVLLGLDFYRNSFDARRQMADVGPAGSRGALDLYEPVYGAAIGSFTTLSELNSRKRQTGVYLQDQISLGNWRLVAGLRHDRSVISGQSRRRSGQTSDLGQRDRATTGRLGALYRFDSGWAPYISYATSFEPVAGVTADGTPFKPMRGKQTELGIKYQPDGARWMATAAVFDLRQTNRLTDDPINGYPEQVQSGELRSRGLELAVTGRLSPNWSVIGSYSFLDTKVISSEIPEEKGQPALYAPRHQAALWVDYTFTGAHALAGTVMGVGVRHVGSSRGGDIGVAGGGYASLHIPAHTVADLRVATQLGRFSPVLKNSELSLSVTNIADKQYVNGCGSLWTCGWGLGRQASLTFSGRF